MKKLCLCVLVCLAPGVFTWWPFSSSDETQVEAPPSTELKVPVHFEMNSAEQKFLAEAQQFLDLSPLDQCQHLVISRLRKSCGEVNEEELGKLAVQLLNCQSQTERRSTYTCTQDMSLADCTSSMDAHTWNTYHIISNRARSVCYATRQQQFRRQTELAVNKLSQSTIEQLQAVQELANSHEEIKQTAQESLQSMHEQQQQFSQQQQALMNSHKGVQEKIAQNIQYLAQEKALIHTGQEQLVNMTESIKVQLEEASKFLGEQEESRREGQSEIIEDITNVKENIHHVWEKLDSSTAHLLEVMEDIGSQYNATLENLRLINSSVASLMSLVVTMDTALSGQLDWLMEQLGGAQNGLAVLITLATHAAFLLLATLCVLFVKAPTIARVFLLLMVCVNAFCEIRFRVSLTLSALTTLQALIVVGNWVYCWCVSKKSIVEQVTPPLAALPPSTPSSRSLKHSPTPHSDDSDIIEPVPAGPETLTHTPTKPLPIHSTPLHHHSLLGGAKCLARTRTGSQCKLPPTPGSALCRRHRKNH